MKYAFVYPGQGAQKIGMGLDFLEEFPEAKEWFNIANDALDFDLYALIRDEQNIHQTQYTQPILLTICSIISQLLNNAGLKPSAVAGLSLGEYSALVESNALTFTQAVDLVAKRGKFMQEACLENKGGMLAILGCENELVEAFCEEISKTNYVACANYNMPGQLIVGGTLEGLRLLKEKLMEKGVKRVIPLQVSGAFHTRMMESACEKFLPYLEKVDWQAPSISIYSNVTGKEYANQDIPSILLEQLTSPVQWQKTIEHLLNQKNITTFIEIGPGKTLTNMIKQIAKKHKKDLQLFQVDTPESLKRVVDFFNQ